MRTIIGTLLIAAALLTIAPASAQNNGQVITSGEGFSYIVNTPVGWESIPGKAREQGLRIIMVPTGASWDAAETVIYSNVTPMSGGDKETVYDIIDYDLDMYQLSDQDLVINDGDRISVNRGKANAIVMLVESPKMGTYEAIAYIDEGDQVPFLVMSSTSKANFERDFPAFETVVASYKYYDNMTVVRGK